MKAEALPEELAILEEIWRSQAAVPGPPVDYTRRELPAPPAPGEMTAETAGELVREALGWPAWTVFFAKPPQAVLAAGQLARQAGCSRGVMWIAPGTGSPLVSGEGEAGLAVLRADWAPAAPTMLAAQEEVRERGMLLMVDESLTGHRLAPGGAVEAFGLEPDLVLYTPALPSRGPLALLAGQGAPPPAPAAVPGPRELAEFAGIWLWARERDLPGQLAMLSRNFQVGLEYFKNLLSLDREVYLMPGNPRMPRIEGQRAWAFMELAREEGLNLSPQLLFDPKLDEAAARSLVWPRLARALARLKVLPVGEMAPLGWKDAGPSRCGQA
ncbi:MAG: hypothetical protein KQJ78_19835 [Deltaproteobacteria bacterium]|nr:hypothetical protein [Deltaproteobacteria bacterium]